MKTLKFESEEAWLEARKCKITGTRVSEVLTFKGNGKKKGYYELIAERLALADVEGIPDNPMDRGKFLQEDALKRFEKESGKKVKRDLVLWVSEDDESIAVSPDGWIQGKKKVVEEAVETKCLGSAGHIEALLTGDVPSEFKYQKLQYFIVNPNLKVLYFCFYDPRMPVKDFFYYTVTRETVQQEIDMILAEEKKLLEEVNEIVKNLSF